MIDFHSHILPNVDDGSKSMDETLNILKEAKQAGFSSIISTSHFIENHFDVNVKERAIIINDIEKQDSSVKVYLGNEIYIADNIIQLLKEGRAASINNTKYILFELPFNYKPMNILDVVYTMLEYEYIPVLAHPERYVFMQEDPSLISSLIEKGVLMQANYGSIIGQYGIQAQILVKHLLKNNMIHFLGSDVHRQNTVYTQMPEILNELKKVISEEKIEEITNTNPKLVLENDTIDIDDPVEIKYTFQEKMKIMLKKGK